MLRRFPYRISSPYREAAIALINKELKVSQAGSRFATRFSPDSSVLSGSNSTLTVPDQMSVMTQSQIELELTRRKERYKEKLGIRAQIGFVSSVALIIYLSFLGYTQLGDACSPIHGWTLRLLRLLEPGDAKSVISMLAERDSLPVDYASEDPYMVRSIQMGNQSKPLLYPVGICSDCGIDAFLKMGFGLVEINLSLSGIDPLENRKLSPLTKFGLVGGVFLWDFEISEKFKKLEFPCDYICFEFKEAISRSIDQFIKFTGGLSVPIFIKLPADFYSRESEAQLKKLKNYISGVTLVCDKSISKELAMESIKFFHSEKFPVFVQLDIVPDAADSLDLIEAGASAIILNVDSVAVNGVGIARKLKSSISDLLARRGYRTLEEAVGAAGRPLTERMIDFKNKKRRF